MSSKYFKGAGEAPVIPHHAKPTSEVGDLRDDTDRGFERVEQEVAELTDLVVPFHKPIVTPSRSSGPPGQQAPVEAVNNLLYLDMTPDTHVAYRVLKVPRNFVQNPAVHIHWTKGDDSDRSGQFARWKVSYAQFQGNGEDASGAGLSVENEDEYEDAGLATRVVYRTPDMPLTGLTAGYYVSFKIEPITPVGAALPTVGLITMDFTYDGYINKDYGAEL